MAKTEKQPKARLFGTDGVRGKANEWPMDSETVLRLGRAVAHVLGQKKRRNKILIGKDTRLSGYMLETALESGMSSMGTDVLLVGPLPTPGVAYMTRSMRADAGVMISASHNPYEDNGIKFFGPDGFKLDDKTEDEIEALLEPGKLDAMRAAPDAMGKAFRIDDALGRYIVYLKGCVQRDCSFEGLKVVLDTANGAAYKVAPLVFSELGMEVITVADKPNGTNINRDCGSMHPENISRLVKEHKAFCGIALDGDADRVVFCDETGEVLDGDFVMMLLAKELKRRSLLKGPAVVATTMSNFGLELALKKEGIAIHRADVGDRYVLARMQELGLNLGGEQSGHIIFLDYNTTGDGVLSALMVLSALIQAGKPMSWVKTLMTKVPQQLHNIPVSRKVPLDQLPKLTAALAQAEATLNSQGRVVLRYSGTEAKLRLMVESQSDALCDSVVANLTQVILEELKSP